MASASQEACVMLLNLPREAMAEEILHKVDELGFRGRYDFLHLPMKSAGYKQNLGSYGYAFINFKDRSSAENFVDAVAKEESKLSWSVKVVLNAAYAHEQDREAGEADETTLGKQLAEAMESMPPKFSTLRPDRSTTSVSRSDQATSGWQAPMYVNVDNGYFEDVAVVPTVGSSCIFF
eukprot:TRINITY_DN41201_c0_g1_i1.p1 TRINITY_DN41201_c0_g1~~TRINITY_DN41201_c0_g1_i1.p1  ORF type:complete len:196 (+),score=40.24 TRINITY_DN41201_c0_g1_i1:57-590(+)